MAQSRETESVAILDEYDRFVSELDLSDFSRVSVGQRVSSRAPARISFAGGTSDTTYFLAQGKPGAVLSATINLYSRCILQVRDDRRIVISSNDLGQIIVLNSIEELEKANISSLFHSVVKFLNPPFGFNLHVRSDFPIGSGLGGSSALICAILGSFNKLRAIEWDKKDIARAAFFIERSIMKVQGGWQDQIACCFGGFNLIEFYLDDFEVLPQQLPHKVSREIESRLLICFTATLHDSGDIHEEQKSMIQADGSRSKAVLANRDLAFFLRDSLQQGDLEAIGETLNKSWHFKKSVGGHVSSKYLDEIYGLALSAGAVGGKLLGAGGGGAFLLYQNQQDAPLVRAALRSHGLRVSRVKFDKQGLIAQLCPLNEDLGRCWQGSIGSRY